MTPIEHLKATVAIQSVADKEGCSPAEIHSAIQEALDVAWGAAWTPGNIHAQVAWQCLFPGAQKPTVEEFIATVAKLLG